MSERFTPESIESDIEALLSEDASGDDARLTRALASLNAPPDGANSALERVRVRVQSIFNGIASLDGAEPGTHARPDGDERAPVGSRLPNGQRSHSHGPIRQMRTVLSAVAALLIAALITGSFVLVFQSRGRPTGPTAQVTATAGKLLGTPTPLPTLGPSALPVPGTPPQWQSHAVPAVVGPKGFGISVDFAVAPSDGTTAYDCHPVPGSGVKSVQQMQIWVTHDLGAHWIHVGNLPELGWDLANCPIDVDMLDSNRILMYLETQNPQTHRNVSEYWASIDGGVTWSKIATTLSQPTAANPLDFIDQIATVGSKTYAIFTTDVSWPTPVPTPTPMPRQPPYIGTRLFAATHIMVSSDRMHTWQPVDGPLLSAVGPNYSISRIWAQPGPGGQAILLADVGTYGDYYGPQMLWESRDGGAEWTQLPAPSLDGFLARASATGHSWYICGWSVTGSPGNGQGASPTPGNQQLVLACSMDGGITWTARPALRNCQSCKGIDAIQNMLNPQTSYLTSDGSLLMEAPQPPFPTQTINLYRLPANSSQWQYLGHMPDSDGLLYAPAPSSAGGGWSFGGYLWGYPGHGALGGIDLSAQIGLDSSVVITAPYPA